ncbi:hypothetical protein Cni_G28337 [Canna indica]|uniref:Non-specific phospholipase C4 n=1 Tax=Canna indica TaxID=4628 RepID=A0AAQ3L3A2_9LILI|nr:hypothetical protein Cni_G28337 [Canna indica]
MALEISPAWSDRIKTVVVLVQENRSFDHMLGWMKSINPAIDGISNDREHSNPLSADDLSSRLVYFGDRSEYVDPDPGHSIQAIYEQVYGMPFAAGSTPITPLGVRPPPMNGFAQQAEKEKAGMSSTVMNGFRPAAVPVAHTHNTENRLPSLPEPTKLRPIDAEEGAKLSEFQMELVQLGATLNGDHAKDTYPHKLVEKMTVAEGAQYLQSDFETFLEECENCRKKGASGSHVVTVNPAKGSKRSLFGKMFSCLACNQS